MEIRGNSLVRRDVVTDGAELETMHNVWCDVLCAGPLKATKPPNNNW